MKDLIPDNILEKVFAQLDNLQPGTILTVSEQAPNKPDLYIACVKQYIDCYGTVDFNEDYTRLRKLCKLK